jgi:GNAT superfamily N-acetyltransferase
MTNDGDVLFRTIERHELPALLDLYRHLRDADAPLPADDVLWQVWEEILQDPKMRVLVADLDGSLVASCTLAIIPNLTRGARPYGLVENVVTHSAHRRQGIGTRLLRHALQTAWEWNCYKVMLLTGSKSEGTLQFYEQAGFRKGIKTGFIAMPERTECVTDQATRDTQYERTPCD